jgi:hypothetical protein
MKRFLGKYYVDLRYIDRTPLWSDGRRLSLTGIRPKSATVGWDADTDARRWLASPTGYQAFSVVGLASLDPPYNFSVSLLGDNSQQQ